MSSLAEARTAVTTHLRPIEAGFGALKIRHETLATAFQAAAVGSPRVVANPSERFEAASKALGDRRREPGVCVVESAREKIAFASGVQREQAGVTFARPGPVGALLPFSRIAILVAIDEQIHLARESRERRHGHAARVILHDQLRNEDRIGEVGERVTEALARVHAAQRVEIGFRVFANEHEGSGK